MLINQRGPNVISVVLRGWLGSASDKSVDMLLLFDAEKKLFLLISVLILKIVER